MPTEMVGQPVGAGLQLLERHDRSRRVQDDGRLVGADVSRICMGRLYYAQI